MSYQALPRLSSPSVIVDALNRVNQGKINATIDVTLTASAASTVVTDARSSINSVIVFDPMTANAVSELAAGTCYIKEADRSNGSFKITHANNSQTDRKFRLLIIG